jgi:hypothetical protein
MFSGFTVLAVMTAPVVVASDGRAFLEEVARRLPSKGSVHAVYESASGLGIRMVGYDIESGANYLALSGSRRSILIKDSKGDVYHFRSTEDELKRSPIVGIERVGMLDPKVVNELLFVRLLQAKRFPQAVTSAQINGSGEWEVEFSIPGGSWFTLENFPDVPKAISSGTPRPGWRFGTEGVLLPEVSKIRVRNLDFRVTGEAFDNGEFQDLDNDVRADLSVRATFGGANGYRLRSIEVVPEGRVSDFHVDAIIDRVKAVVPARESTAKPMPLDLLAKGVDVEGRAIPYTAPTFQSETPVVSFHRALVVSGVLTCMLALFVMWKKRA